MARLLLFVLLLVPGGCPSAQSESTNPPNESIFVDGRYQLRLDWPLVNGAEGLVTLQEVVCLEFVLDEGVAYQECNPLVVTDLSTLVGDRDSVTLSLFDGQVALSRRSDFTWEVVSVQGPYFDAIRQDFFTIIEQRRQLLYAEARQNFENEVVEAQALFGFPNPSAIQLDQFLSFQEFLLDQLQVAEQGIDRRLAIEIESIQEGPIGSMNLVEVF